MTVAASYSNVLTVIPARLASVRLPEKLLADIHGKPLIYWVANRIRHFGLTDFVVATDSDLIADVCSTFDFPFIMTSTSCENGTERVHEVSQKHPNYSYFMNVQGDEPLIGYAVLTKMLQSAGLRDNSFKVAVSPLNRSSNDLSEAKVAMQSDGVVRYVSRLPVPFRREGGGWLHKIQGVFLYTPEVLDRFVNGKVGVLEESEKLEQLRCIENNIELFAVMCEASPKSVDTLADLNLYRSMPMNLFEDFSRKDA